MSVIDKIIRLTKQLYPTGRAFKIAEESFFKKLHNGLAESEKRAWDDGVSTLNSTLPDNNSFTADDATAWERRLGLITNDAVSLADRKAAIIRKINHPGTIPARENYRFLERQLQAAGFDVYVHENRFPNGMGGYITKTPEEIVGGASSSVQLGDSQLGDSQLGDGRWDLVANYIDETIDANFNIGLNNRSTFFISSSYISDFADVDIERKEEFRQLILRTKPTQTVAYLFVNYV